jgi:hypothetical protein
MPRLNICVISFLAIMLNGFSAQCQQMPQMGSDSSKFKNNEKKGMDNMMNSMAHPFFTHMGMPQSVGRYSLRFASFLTQIDKKSYVDFDLQFETGLTKFAGLLIKMDDSKTEIMFHILALKSKNGMNAFSPLIEFEIPTHEGVYTQIGFSTTLSNSRIAFHQVIHYGLRENNFEGSVALVFKVSKRVFLISELLGEKKFDEETSLNLLGGLKVRLNDHLLLALGFQVPVTKKRDFSSQYIFQPDLQLKN